MGVVTGQDYSEAVNNNPEAQKLRKVFRVIMATAPRWLVKVVSTVVTRVGPILVFRPSRWLILERALKISPAPMGARN